jgi:putative DNA primase/helicase
VDKPHGNTAGWCFLFEDGEGGCYGDWSTGFSANWHAKRDHSLSPAERTAYARKVKKARAKAQAEREAMGAEAAARGVKIWDAARPAPDNYLYLRRKGVKAHGARLYKGALALPVMDFTDRITSVQFIGTDGRKRLLSGGRKRGCFIPVGGNMVNPSRVIICEGWTTGCTLSENEPAALVLAGIDARNLEPVAVAARHHWPSAELVIAADDDRLTAGNPGATQARAAAIASGALLALPKWPEGAPDHLTDFNDLVAWVAGGRA